MKKTNFRAAVIILFVLISCRSSVSFSAEIFKFTRAGNTGYLFGSVHGAVRGLAFPTEKVRKAIGNSTAVVFESAGAFSEKELLEYQLDEQSSRHVFEKLSEKSKECLNDSLNGIVTYSTRKVPPQRKQHPVLMAYFLADYLYGAIKIENSDNPSVSFDEEVGKLASARGLPFTVIESQNERAIRLKNQEDIDKFVSGVCLALTQEKRGRSAKIYAMLIFASFNTGNLDLLEVLTRKLHSEVFDMSPRVIDSILADRNQNFVDRLELGLAVNGTVPFVVVGAAHLGSDKGVLKILQRRGFQISTVD